MPPSPPACQPRINPVGLLPRVRFYLLFGVVFTLAQFAGYLSLYGVEFTAVIWPAIGIYGATLAMCQRRHWPWLAGIMVVIDLVASYLSKEGDYTPELIGFWCVQVIVNPTTGLIFAAIVQRFVDECNPLSNPRSLAVYTFIAITLNISLVTLTGWALYGLMVPNIKVIDGWQQWAYSDIMGLLTTATPLILFILADHRKKLVTRKRLEGVLLIALFTITLLLVVGAKQTAQTSIQYYQTLLLIPYFVWAFARYGPFVLTLMASLLTLTALFSLAAERGPFWIEGRSEFNNTLMANAVLLPINIAILLVSSMLEGQRRYFAQLLRVEQQQRRLDRFETLGTIAGGGGP